MYERSARLTASICERHGIPRNRGHIIGHHEVPGSDHTDPGRHWDWKRYLRLVKSA
jgi:N-acetyl-anhydromuramyl-L-alanine amidase AmpD